MRLFHWLNETLPLVSRTYPTTTLVYNSSVDRDNTRHNRSRMELLLKIWTRKEGKVVTLHLCDRCGEKAHTRIVVRRVPVLASDRVLSIMAIGKPEITMDLCQGCYHALKAFLIGEKDEATVQ